jgi:Tat protein translocase TatB subunit
MFDIAWTEWLFILVLALVLLGPREMASILRTVGRWVGQLRRLAQDFYQQIEAIEGTSKSPHSSSSPSDKIFGSKSRVDPPIKSEDDSFRVSREPHEKKPDE